MDSLYGENRTGLEAVKATHETDVQKPRSDRVMNTFAAPLYSRKQLRLTEIFVYESG